MDEDTEKKAKVIRGTVALSIREVFGSFISIFFFAIVVRELKVEGMAVVSILQMMYTLFPLIFLISIPTAIQRFIAEHIGKDDKTTVKGIMKTALIILLVSSAASLASSFALAPLIANVLFGGKHLWALQLVSLAIATYIANSILGAVFFGFQFYEKYSAITFVGRLSGRLFALILIILNYGLPAFVASWIIENIVIIILLTTMMPKIKTTTSQAYPIKPLIVYSFPLFCTTFVSYLGSGVFIKLLILNKLPSTDLGKYETSIRATGVLRQYQSTFLATFFPHLSKIYGEKGVDEVGQNVSWAVCMLSFVFSPVIIGLGVLAKPLFYIFFGIELIEATPIFITLLIFSLLNFVLSPFTQGMQTLGYTKKMFHIQLVSTMLALVSSFVLIRFGVLGVTIGAEILGLTSSVLNFYLFKKYVNPKIDWKKATGFTLAALTMVPLIYLSSIILPSYRYLLIQIFLGVGSYLTLVRIFKLVDKKDVNAIASVFPGRLRMIVLKLFNGK